MVAQGQVSPFFLRQVVAVLVAFFFSLLFLLVHTIGHSPSLSSLT